MGRNARLVGWHNRVGGGLVGNVASVLGIDGGVAQTTFGGSVDGPGHVVQAPVIRLVVGLFGGRFSWRGRHLFPSFIMNLLTGIPVVLLVFGLGIGFGSVAAALAFNLLPI